jgi:SsrA-binding protein
VSIVENRKAFHDYFIRNGSKWHCARRLGMKAIRGGRANLKEAYASPANGELMRIGAHICRRRRRRTCSRPDANAAAVVNREVEINGSSARSSAGI